MMIFLMEGNGMVREDDSVCIWRMCKKKSFCLNLCCLKALN